MKLLERLSRIARRRGMADASIDASRYRVRNDLAFCAGQRGEWLPPERLHSADVEALLNHLGVARISGIHTRIFTNHTLQTFE